jgi:hypothetical protein
VDVAGWTVTGGIAYTIPQGVVIAAATAFANGPIIAPATRSTPPRRRSLPASLELFHNRPVGGSVCRRTACGRAHFCRLLHC